MKGWNRRKLETAKRWGSILMMISLLAGSVSIASFAKGADKSGQGWAFGIDIAVQKTKSSTRRSRVATPSGLSTASNADQAADGSSLSELLEQTDDCGAITAEWFRVKLDDTVISDSNDYSLRLAEGTMILPDGMVEHRLQVKISPQLGELEEGDMVSWNLGRIQGLNLPRETCEWLTINGTDIGFVCLNYTSDGTLFLTTEFYDAIQSYGQLTVTYWYESTFVPVAEETVLEIDLPGYEEPGWAVLLPGEPEETSTETAAPEPTDPDETSTATAAPTLPEPTDPEEPTASHENPTVEEPTTEEVTVPETTKGSGKKKGSGSSSVNSVPVTTAAETTAAAETIAGAETTAAAESIIALTEGMESTEPAQPPANAEFMIRPGKNESAVPGSDSNSGSIAEGAAETEAAQIAADSLLKLEVMEVAAGQSRVQPGDLLVYRMAVRNESTEIIKDIRIRDYLPDYTSFVAVEDGSYGVINGRQHVTWMLDQLQPGEQKELVLSVRVFPCVPMNYRIENQIYWGAGDRAKTNAPENPSEVKLLPAIIIG